MEIAAIHNEPIDEVTYIVTDANDEAIIIDPWDYHRIHEYLSQEHKTCAVILLTHEHYDHIGAVNELKDFYYCKLITSEVCSEQIKNSRTNLSAFKDVLMEFHGVSNYKGADSIVIKQVDQMFSDEMEWYWNEHRIYMVETPGHSPGSICIEIDQNVFTGDSLLKDIPVTTRLPGGSKKDYLNKTLPYLKNIPKDYMVYPGHGEAFRMRESVYLKKI